MPESSQPPHPPVSTVARMLATVALLHGSNLDHSGLDHSGLDATTATALVDAVAYLTATGDTDGADALLRLVTTDPDTIAAAHVALHVPARRPNRTAPTTGGPPPPLPQRIPRPYRDPGEPDPAARRDATAPATEPDPTPSDPGPQPARPAARTDDPAGSEASSEGRSDDTERLPLPETRRWQEATAAQVLLLDYAVSDAEGRVTGVYTPVPIVHPPGWCDHLDTLCGGCLPGWSEDHAVAVFRHGIDGTATGCRCPVCRTTIPAQPDRHPDPNRHPGPDPDPDRPTLGDPGGSTTGRDTSWFGEEGS